MVYKRLKALRVMNDLGQRDMAKKLGMAVSTYNHKENGSRDFYVEEAKRICVIFDKKFEDIFFD